MFHLIPCYIKPKDRKLKLFQSFMLRKKININERPSTKQHLRNLSMDRSILRCLFIVLNLQNIGASLQICPTYKNCTCGGTINVKVECFIDGQSVKIDILPGVYLNLRCENITKINYNDLPNGVNRINNFKSVSFINCPVPTTSFKEVLTSLGANNTMTLIFQSNKNLSINFQRNHFSGLQDLTKLLLSCNHVINLPNNLFADLNNLRWLNIRIKSVSISEELFKPLMKLDTLEISHNHMTNISSHLFQHLTYLRKFSIWQSNISTFSNDFFVGVESLEDLDISSTFLSQLPNKIFYPLKNLKKLTFFSNKFSLLPSDLFLRNKLIDTIIILNNNVKLRELPQMFLANLPSLKKIHIQRCAIEIIPKDIFLNSSLITNISLARNEIRHLPESVFNNQINLLELDLSFNDIKSLDKKIFSSLVRLERLNLCCNAISEISGSTFTSLLSLTYLNMERNKLKFISSYLFENNKRRISVSLAFNELTFENKILVNNSWNIKKNCPLMYTYNLKMLNLSHNKFKVAFKDWWINGHENLDLRFNFIQTLWDDQINGFSQNYKTAVNAPLKEIWIANNEFSCSCENLWFLDFIQTRWKTKVADIDYTKCSAWSSRIKCYAAFYVIIFITAIVLVVILTSTIFYLIQKKVIHSFLKIICFKIFKPISVNQNEKNCQLALRYSIVDEDFVLKEIVPGLQNCKNVKLFMIPVSTTNNKSFSFKKKHDCHIDVTLVIFSANYLMTTYSHVNIKKIRGEMLKARKTIYIFVDTGHDNSIYAFLKEQRDIQMSVLWNEQCFWSKVIDILSVNSVRQGKLKPQNSHLENKSNVLVNEIKKVKFKYSTKKTFMKLSDWPHIDTFETYAHSQV